MPCHWKMNLYIHIKISCIHKYLLQYLCYAHCQNRQEFLNWSWTQELHTHEIIHTMHNDKVWKLKKKTIFCVLKDKIYKHWKFENMTANLECSSCPKLQEILYIVVKKILFTWAYFAFLTLNQLWYPIISSIMYVF